MVKVRRSQQPKEDKMPDESVFGAMRVDPKPYKANWNRNLYERTKYAIAGLLFMITREKSVRNIVLGAIVTFGLALWMRIDTVHTVILILSFGMLWTVETMNSAIEAVVDMVTQEYHPMAKVAKDVAASATLIATLTTILIASVLVVAPVIERVIQQVKI